MQYGLHIHNLGDYANPRLLVDLAREAEDAGWDGVFVCDHLTAQSANGLEPIADPWIALAAIATATSRVKIGPMVTPVPRRRPWQLASETVTLDLLSNGRLILGVGSGTGLAQSFHPFGEEMDGPKRGRMLDEALSILSLLWMGKTFHYDGDFYQINGVAFLPRPVQQPRIPIWVAGTWPHRRPFRRAAQWDGFFPDIEGIDWMRNEIMTPADLRTMVDYVRSEQKRPHPFEVVIGGRSPADRSEAVAFVKGYADAGLTWWLEGIHQAFATVDEHRARIRRGPPKIE